MIQKSEMSLLAAKSTEFLDAAKSSFHLPYTGKLAGHESKARQPLRLKTSVPGSKRQRKPKVGVPDTWLPDRIDGLNIPAGLQLMGHDRGLYLHSLRTFVATRHSVIAEIGHLLQAGEAVKALREADKLKAQAAYLGAKNLQQAAGQLEDTHLPRLVVFPFH
jgi:hypothetical protein